MSTTVASEIMQQLAALQAQINGAVKATEPAATPATNGKGKKAAPKTQAPSNQGFALPDGVTKVAGGYSIFVPENGRFHVSKSGKSEVFRIQYTAGKGTYAASVFGYFNRPL